MGLSVSAGIMDCFALFLRMNFPYFDEFFTVARTARLFETISKESIQLKWGIPDDNILRKRERKIYIHRI